MTYSLWEKYEFSIWIQKFWAIFTLPSSGIQKVRATQNIQLAQPAPRITLEPITLEPRKTMLYDLYPEQAALDY